MYMRLVFAVCGMCNRHLRFSLQLFSFVYTLQVPMVEGHGRTGSFANFGVGAQEGAGGCMLLVPVSFHATQSNVDDGRGPVS